MSNKLTLMTSTETVKEIGLYMRVHTDIRSYRSRFADHGTGSLGGLWPTESSQITNVSDKFYVIDNSFYDTAQKRDLLERMLKKAGWTADSAAIRSKIDTFFEEAKKQKNLARLNSARISAEEAERLQDSINVYAVRAKCIHLSLIRLEGSAFNGAKQTSKDNGLYRKEVKLSKVYVPEDTEVTEDLILRILAAAKDVELNKDVQFALLEERLADGSKGTKVTRVTSSNAQDIMLAEAAKSELSKGEGLGSVRKSVSSIKQDNGLFDDYFKSALDAIKGVNTDPPSGEDAGVGSS